MCVGFLLQHKEEVSLNSVFFVAGVRSPRRSVEGSLWRVHCFSVCGQQEVMSAVTPQVSPGSVQVIRTMSVDWSSVYRQGSVCFLLKHVTLLLFTALHQPELILTQEAAGCYHDDRFHLSYTSSSLSFLFGTCNHLMTPGIIQITDDPLQDPGLSLNPPGKTLSSLGTSSVTPEIP